MSGLPLIVDIKRGSHEDGPGIRSVVFFKGCPLRCVFCHNPETQDTEVEIAFRARDCLLCGRCAEVCKSGAIDLGFHGRILRERCTRCGECVSVCSGGALRLIGRRYTVETLTEILLRDESFYRHSGGGVTLSGGECTLSPDYLELLLKGLKKRDIHVVLETSGHFNYDIFKKRILPYLDLVYYDIKLADPDLHKKFLGISNETILANLVLLIKENSVEVHPRVPLIPGVTVTRENISAIVSLLCSTGAEDISLLPYNPLGLDMYASLGRPKPPLPEGFMKPDEEKLIMEMFKEILKEAAGGSVDSKDRPQEHL